MAKKKNKKVVRYRRPLNINVGMIIFFIIFIYLVFSVYTYLKREKIQFYEVVDGGIVNNRIYNGLILREEQVRTADRSGYINYYLREGKRASVGSRIYSLDETGNLEALLKENAEEGSSLSDDSLSDLKKQLTSFVLSFDATPEGLSDVKNGDTVTVTYTGELSEVDAFTGTVISVKKAEK